MKSPLPASMAVASTTTGRWPQMMVSIFSIRAVGCSQSIAWASTVFTAIGAESIDCMAGRVQEVLTKGFRMNAREQAVCTDVLAENTRIIFNGDNYALEWHEDAGKRGLPNH